MYAEEVLVIMVQKLYIITGAWEKRGLAKDKGHAGPRSPLKLFH